MQVNQSNQWETRRLNAASARNQASDTPEYAAKARNPGSQDPASRPDAGAAPAVQARTPGGASISAYTPASTIFGANAKSAPQGAWTQSQREQRADAYVGRVKTQLADIEHGSEAQRNVKFLNARPFMSPAGFFSGGLMAAGYDPNEKIDVRFDQYTGIWRPQSRSGSDQRSYHAWEIAAGALEHDRPEKGGLLNFQRMRIAPADQAKVQQLTSLGANLQAHWDNEIAGQMNDASSPLVARSGKADAYSTQATLQSLRSDKEAFARLSPEGRQAINRTLDHAGQVIIPNVYGYPLAGHAFVPYQPYDGNYEHRPNQGLMIGLNQGTVSEINGDKGFADWAKRNQNELVQHFNARDRQGGLDAHWPKADDVLSNLTGDEHVTYPGYKNRVSDMRIPVRETFNYTRARGADYQLKYGNLTAGANGGIASHYQAVNANNAAWADQTQVFGAAAQNWKTARGIWGSTLGNLPLVGSVGNMAFGVHDSLYGMTAKDRIGGNVAATLSGLQLAHELAPGAAALTLGKPAAGSGLASARASAWKLDPKTSEFRFAPPQRVNGQIGYPMSPVEPPRIPGVRPLSGVSEQGAPIHQAAEAEVPYDSTAPLLQQERDKPVIVKTDERHSRHGGAANLVQAVDQRASDTAAGGAGKGGAHDKSPGSSRLKIDVDHQQPGTSGAGAAEALSVRPLSRSESSESLLPASLTDSPRPSHASPRIDDTRPESSPGTSQAASRRTSVQSAHAADRQGMGPLSGDEDAGFRKHFPGGMGQAEAYLKSKSMSMTRAPGYLSSDQYPAPRSWPGLSDAEKAKQFERYLSVWDPEPKRADYGTVEDFTKSYNDYHDRIDKFKQDGHFNLQEYWDDMTATQNGKYKSFVDNQTKRLAVATKAYDDFIANPTQYRVKPDDPYELRKQMTGKQDGKRDAMFLQREAMDFAENSFYTLDGRNVSELRSSLKKLFSGNESRIESAFLYKKKTLEGELYRYAGSRVSREMVEAKKKALQDRFNSDIATAGENMNRMYKRLAVYGTLGALSISGTSALLWKAIDEIRGGNE